MKPYYILILLIMLASPELVLGQESGDFVLSCEIDKVYPAISINESNLEHARTITDLNRYFKTSWVKEYESVELIVSQNGKQIKSIGQDSLLTEEQRTLLNTADVKSNIIVKVRYLPENTLKNNEVKDFSFSCSIDPKHDAEYIGGENALNAYFKSSVVDHLPEGTIGQYQLTAVKFIISNTGDIENAHIFWSSEDLAFDTLMLNAVCNMPKWIPAKYADGLEANQEFALRLGDMTSCVSNMLNIRLLPIE